MVRKRQLKSDINVTPFVDVMLVLLVIFMITSSLIISGVNVNLPEVDSYSKQNNKEKTVTISITKRGEVYIGSEKVPMKNIKTRMMKVNKGAHILLRGDVDIKYGELMKIFAILKELRLEKISLVTSIP